jgi:hypothetical protein
METQTPVEQPTLFGELPSRRFRRSRRRLQSRWATCVHEAAHAVLALWFRIAFAAATIRPSMGGVAGSLILNHETFVVPNQAPTANPQATPGHGTTAAVLSRLARPSFHRR